MHPIESALVSCFQFTSNPIIISYSGGVDSQVLLHALVLLKQQKHLNNELTVIHVNHQLSSHSCEWAEFAKNECNKVAIPCQVISVEVEKGARKSVEQEARKARYQALKTSIKTPSFIVTGHHANDQAETFLLALKRGSGIKGLGAMKASVAFERNQLVRPLLSISRSQIMDYAKFHGLSWVEDESNNDQRFDRNFLRHTIMPELLSRWPAFLTTVSRSAKLCQNNQELVDELAQLDVERCVKKSNESWFSLAVLNIETLLSLSVNRQNNVLRYVVEQNNGLMPSHAQLLQVHGQLQALADKTPEVKVGQLWFRRHKQELHLTDELPNISHFQDVQFSEPTEIELPNKLGCLVVSKLIDNTDVKPGEVVIKAPTENAKYTLTFNHNNPNCCPDYRQKNRSLKKIFQELNIPSWQRTRLPLIFSGKELVAVPRFFVCKQFVPNENDLMLKISWREQQ